MSKKHFIAMADALRSIEPVNIDERVQWLKSIEALADFCAEQNPLFNRERWIGYIKGLNGAGGGAL